MTRTRAYDARPHGVSDPVTSGPARDGVRPTPEPTGLHAARDTGPVRRFDPQHPPRPGELARWRSGGAK